MKHILKFDTVDEAIMSGVHVAPIVAMVDGKIIYSKRTGVPIPVGRQVVFMRKEDGTVVIREYTSGGVMFDDSYSNDFM